MIYRIRRKPGGRGRWLPLKFGSDVPQYATEAAVNLAKANPGVEFGVFMRRKLKITYQVDGNAITCRTPTAEWTVSIGSVEFKMSDCVERKGEMDESVSK